MTHESKIEVSEEIMNQIKQKHFIQDMKEEQTLCLQQAENIQSKSKEKERIHSI